MYLMDILKWCIFRYLEENLEASRMRNELRLLENENCSFRILFIASQLLNGFRLPNENGSVKYYLHFFSLICAVNEFRRCLFIRRDEFLI